MRFKATIPVIAVLLLSLFLVSCGTSEKNVSENTDPLSQKMIDDIDSIGEVTLDDEQLILQLIERYATLTDEQKEKVTNYVDLLTAQDELNNLMENLSVEPETDEAENMDDVSVTTGKFWDAGFDTYVFGKYEQDKIEENGPEDIEWYILDENDGKKLLLSKYALDYQMYNDDYATWETSHIREWLNDEFYNQAFSEEEKNRISLSLVKNDNNPWKNTDGGNDTEDYVFLLSFDEVHNYFDFDFECEDGWDSDWWYGYSKQAICTPTKYTGEETTIDEDMFFGREYALDKQKYSEEVIGTDCISWWLRSTGGAQDTAGFVGPAGNICVVNGYPINGEPVMARYGIRPAIWIAE